MVEAEPWRWDLMSEIQAKAIVFPVENRL